MSLRDVTVSQSFADLAHAGTVPALLSVSLIKAAVELLLIRFCGHEDPSPLLQSLNPSLKKTSLCTDILYVCVFNISKYSLLFFFFITNCM